MARAPLPKHLVGVEKCERYSAKTSICVKGNKYGLSATLRSDAGGSLPISFGADEPRTIRDAFKAAHRFLARVHGKNN